MYILLCKLIKIVIVRVLAHVVTNASRISGAREITHEYISSADGVLGKIRRLKFRG